MSRFAMFALASTIIASTFAQSANAQDFWRGAVDRVRGQLQGEVRNLQREVLGALPVIPQRGGGSGQLPPQQGSLQSLPNEGGSQNIGGRFEDSGFFNPQPSPGQIVQPINPSPRNGQPIPGYSQPIPSYGQPVPSYSQPLYGQPLYSQPIPQSSVQAGSPPLRVNAPAVRNGLRIKIRLGETLKQTVTYKILLNGKSYPYSMRTGESQSFDDTQEWFIRFIHGNSEVTYRLVGGNHYTFDIDGSGDLQLYKEPMIEATVTEPPLRTSN